MKNQKTEKKGDKVIRKYEEFTRDILETIREPLLVLNADLRVVSANRAFYRTFATKPEETEGMSIYELGNRQWDIPELRKLLEEILPGNTSFDDFEVTHDFQSVGRKTMLLNARRIYDGRGKTQMVLLAMEDVTERHQARASLTASEEKYRDLVEKAGIAILIDDKEGNFQYVNKRFAEMFGYSVEEMKRQSIQSLVHPEDVERVMKLHKERIEGRKSESKYEFRGVRKDGSVIFLEVDAVALEEGNRIVGTRSYIWDITERKEAEQALKEGEAKYRAIVEQSHDEIFIYRGDKFLYVNDRLCETSGYTKDELYQMEIWDLIHPEDRERVKKIGQDRAKGKNVPSRYFARGLTKTGEIRHCEFSVNVISYRGEYAVLGTVRDITDRVNFEKALEESERKYRTLTENINDIVYSSDSKGIITYISPQVKRFGFKPEEIVSRKFRDFTEFIAPEDREKLMNNFQRTMRTGKEFVTEFRIVDKKGQVHWMEDFSRVQRDESGKIVGLIGILRDISERKRAEREIQKSNRKLYKALEDTVHALASAVEKRDPSTAGHQKHVALLACAIAEEMGLPEDRIKGIRMAGLVHDIGKINIPAEILSKTAPLSDAEIALIRTHPKVGYDILSGIDFPWPVAKIVLQHHERMLGSGYPAGLTGEDILLEARILAVADVVEAMYSHRPYRPAHGIEEALREISRNRAILYDPVVVDACLVLFKEKGYKLEEAQNYFGI